MRVQVMIKDSLANQTVLSFYLIIKAYRHDTQATQIWTHCTISYSD